jgi:DNA-binding HxlR family transcriptional regulator
MRNPTSLNVISQEVTKRLPVRKRKSTLANQRCAVIAALRVFATKWKPCILCYLAERPVRYNELYRIIPNISRKMLSEHLKELEKDSLITRTQLDNKKQHVEYALSEKGKSLLGILEELERWGIENLKDVVSIKKMISLTMNPN